MWSKIRKIALIIFTVILLQSCIISLLLLSGPLQFVLLLYMQRTKSSDRPNHRNPSVLRSVDPASELPLTVNLLSTVSVTSVPDLHEREIRKKSISSAIAEIDITARVTRRSVITVDRLTLAVTPSVM